MADNHTSHSPISFGPFQLFPGARLLKKDGVALSIGSRALDILIFLAERPGEVVDKRELIKGVWANVNVDEGSLRFHVTGLRKALGEAAGAQYVKNVPGRGYCFAALPALSEQSASASFDGPSSRTSLLPPQTAKLIGRAEAIEKVSVELLQHRILTIVGPGGIGKTSVAIAVAHRELAASEARILFVDLGGVTDARLVPGTIASVLGLTVNSQDPVPSLLTFLRGQRSLLIFDCCEHVLEVLAPLVEQIAREAPEARILATSREALRIESERIFRLLPLSFPLETASLKAADMLAYPATQLFIERMAASSDARLSDAEAPMVAEICQHLDGIPLAIELAAGRVSAYGIGGTASLLDGHMSLLWRGRRTAIPRHQTLNAALAWSYDLLSPLESATLRRLSTLVGPFTLEAAIAIASSREVSKSEAVEAIANLVSKSLIFTPSERPRRYRLLDATRAFARKKLEDSGEADQAARAHANYFRDYLTEISTESARPPSDGRFLPHADQLPNVRAALDWSFSDSGDPAMGVELAAAATQFFLELSWLTECHRWAQHALTLLEPTSIGGRQEMELQAALGTSLMFTQPDTGAVRSAFMRSLTLAEQLSDPVWQLWILGLLQIYYTRIADFQGALDVAMRGAETTASIDDPASALYAQWSLGVAHHMTGNQRKVVELCENALVQSPVSQSYTRHLGYDNRLFALFAFARGLWLTGRPDRAVDVAMYTISEAERVRQPLSLSLALVFIIPVFLWVGDWINAERLIDKLLDHTTKHGFAPHNAVGIGLKGELLLGRGDIDGGIDHLCRSQATLQRIRYRMMTTTFATGLAEARALLNQFEEALRAIDEGITNAGDSGESFNKPEMLRVKGLVLRCSGRTAEAETFLQKSLELSRTQCALGWELRAALTLGRLWREVGRPEEARALVEPLYGRYEEGFESRDVVAARRFLDDLNR